MSDRSWNPQAMRSFADFQKRQAKADARLGRLFPPPPPPPLPMPPMAPRELLKGFKVQAGACRDSSGGYGRSPRIEGLGLHFSHLVATCVALGWRCDAVDINGHAPRPDSDPVMGWAAIWGRNLTVADANNATGGPWTFFCDGNCANDTNVTGRICRGDPHAGPGNVCYSRLPCNTSSHAMPA